MKNNIIINITDRKLLKILILVWFFLLISICMFDSSIATTTLTVEDVRRIALKHNRTYLAAKEDVIKAQSDITKARAGALPNITLNSNYSRNFKLSSFFVQMGNEPPIEFKTGFNNEFRSSLSIQQSLWSGGQVFTALKIAKLYKKYSLEKEKEVKASIIYNAELLFYKTILTQSNLQVLQKAFEANSYNLEVVEKYYVKGTVSKFEVLRAKVEKSNLQPQILKAKSDLTLSQKRLKSFLGIDLNEDIVIVDTKDDTTLANLLPLSSLIDAALQNRPEIRQSNYLTEIAKKGIRISKGDYLPKLNAVSSYNWSASSDNFTSRENNVRSWSAGINLSIPIFKGGSTRGEVKNSVATYHQALLNDKQLKDNVKLEVEESYDNMLQAKKTLDIQGETIAEAEEGLKIANVRYKSGVGILLEVLSAQTALTQARNSLALATFVFRQARAQLKKATTVDIDKK